MGFRPGIAQHLKRMDERLFAVKPMGLRLSSEAAAVARAA
jgi:acyl CoA:acetate/3-ketoacid CoA transferase